MFPIGPCSRMLRSNLCDARTSPRPHTSETDGLIQRSAGQPYVITPFYPDVSFSHGDCRWHKNVILCSHGNGAKDKDTLSPQKQSIENSNFSAISKTKKIQAHHTKNISNWPWSDRMAVERTTFISLVLLQRFTIKAFRAVDLLRYSPWISANADGLTILSLWSERSKFRLMSDVMLPLLLHQRPNNWGLQSPRTSPMLPLSPNCSSSKV